MPDIGIKDVAALAGVSVTSVSYALNRPDRVSPKTAALVADAVRSLGYVPNIAARQLKAGKSYAIGLAVVNIANPFFSDVSLGAEDAAEEAGYSLLVGNSHDSRSREERYLDLFERQRVDGVLIAPRVGSLDHLDRFTQRRTPVVLVDRVDPAGRYSSVSLDDVLGGRLATRKLIETGCRSLLYIGGHFGVVQMAERRDGFVAEAAAAGVAHRVWEPETLNIALGREYGDRIADLPRHERPDGIFTGNDELALGILQRLLHRGIDVPGDISIIGYDDIAFSEAAIVPLTSIRQPSRAMGVRSAELLLELIAKIDRGERTAVETARFQPELVERESTR